MSASTSSCASTLEDFRRFFSRSAEGGDIMKYMYLAPGDRFGALTKLPAYYVTEDELHTLDEQAPLLATSLLRHRLAAGTATTDAVAQMHVVEWGPGPGHIVQRKTLPLLDHLAHGPCQLSYEAVDVNASYACDAADVVACALAKDVGEEVMVTEGDFFEHAAQQADRRNGPPTCMLFWGVTFGNFDGTERERLIASIKSYDLACFTVDHNLDLESLSQAYDNPELHSIVMGALEHFQTVVEDSAGVSGFNIDAWEAEVCFEPQHSDASGDVDELLVACYVRSLCDQTLVFHSLGAEPDVVRIAANERFRVLQSRKYSQGRVRELFESVPSEQPKEVFASSALREGSRIGLFVVSGQQPVTKAQGGTAIRSTTTTQTTSHVASGVAAASKLQPCLVTGVVLLALLVDYMLLTVLVPLLPHIQEDFDVPGYMTGLLLAMKPLVQLIFDPLVAPFTDHGHTWPLLAGLAFETVTALGFALSKHFALLMASRGFQGIASAMILNVSFAMISRAFADDDATRGIVMSVAAVGITAGAALGPVLSGQLFRISGMQFTFVVAAAVACIAFAVSALVLSCVERLQRARSQQALPACSKREQDCDASDTAGKQSRRHAFRTILSDGGMRTIYFSIFVCNVVYASVEATLGAWIERDLGLPTSSVGHVLLGLTLPLLVLFPLSGWLGNCFGRARTVAAGLGIMGVAAVLLPATGRFGTGVIALTLALLGVGIAGVDGCAPALLAKHVDSCANGSRLYGSAFALKGMATSAGFMLGPISASALATFAGFASAAFAAAGLAFVCMPLMLVQFQRPHLMDEEKGKETSDEENEAADAGEIESQGLSNLRA